MVSSQRNQSWLENATGKKSMGIGAESTEEEGTLSAPRVQDNGMDSDTRTLEEESAARETRLEN